MRRRSFALLVLISGVLLLCGPLDAGGGDKFPAKGSLVPGPFLPYNLNGAKGKDRFHCLVCEYGLKPVVMVFVREAKVAEKGILSLLKRLDQAVEQNAESYLSSFVVFLHEDAATAVTDGKDRISEDPGKSIEDTKKLVKETAAREKLLDDLRAVAKDLKHVVVASYPLEGPEKYKEGLGRELGVTVILYFKHRVVESYRFPEGKLNEEAVMKGVDALLAATKAPAKLTSK
jgi:hypothetical protein